MSAIMDPVVLAGVEALATLYAGSAASPEDVTAGYFERIAAINPRLNAFLFLDPDGAREAAQRSAARWRAGEPLSAIDGAPIGIKANIAVEGWPWHAGVAAYRDRVAPTDAACVTRLKAAGAVLLGGLNMHEAALGGTNDNLAFGRCRNPYDLARTPGGSSGGAAAAVAAGLCAAAIGTDTLGSVRIPASYCGVFGCKPRFGAISTAGVTPLSWTLDTVGVLARGARDVAAMLAVLTPTAEVSDAVELEGLRLGAVTLPAVGLEAEVARVFQSTLAQARRAGALVETIPSFGHDPIAARKAALLVLEAEGFVEHEARLLERPDGFTPGLTSLLTWGARQPASKLASAYRLLDAMGRRIREIVSAFDAVLTPSTPQVAFVFEAPPPPDQADFTLLANLAGLPAVAFPAGPTLDGLPTSMQVVATREAMCLRVAGRLAQTQAPPPRA